MTDVHREWLMRCLDLARRSPDPNTKVGSMLVNRHGEWRSSGMNRFAAGIVMTPERLADRETKNALMVHAEQSAIVDAARRGSPTEGCTLYTACTDDSGEIWGGRPVPAGACRSSSRPASPRS